VIDKTFEKTEANKPSPPAPADGQDQFHGHQWTSSLSQIATEDIIAIGNGRHAHFRRDRRFAQVQVVFTAPEGVDPNPGRELTGQFKEIGWTWRPNEPGKPWTYQLEQSSEHDPTARGDSRDALHELFVDIIQEYREKHGMPPTSGWRNLADSDTKVQNADRSSVADQPARISEKQMLKSAAEETRAGGQGGVHPAQAMLEAFASVGAVGFDLTFTDASGEMVRFRGDRPLGQLRSVLPAILQQAEERQHNVIVRPNTEDATLIQLDDLGDDKAAELRSVSFLILCTSPGNYQAWVAVADGDADFARRLKKGAGADPTASGATRVSGSINFKEKHAPRFPRVETVHASPGRVVSRADLEALGVVAPPEKPNPGPVRTSPRLPGGKGWPNYQQCVEKAPLAKSGDKPDISRADFTFCLLAIDWGWSVEETAARLMQESGKAQTEGEKYAMRTASKAGEAIERRRGGAER